MAEHMAQRATLILTMAIYRPLMFILRHIAVIIGWFSPVVREYLKDRSFTEAALNDLRHQRTLAKGAVVFYCSSAGEYEQAKPLMERLQLDKILSVIVFFSRSGLRYASIRAESSPMFLSPLDGFRTWEQFFNAVRPQVTIVVRHEFWPAFLLTARRHSHLMLIDATASPSIETSALWSWVKGLLIGTFHSIHLVDQKDLRQFAGPLRVADNLLHVSGDTKYDRVVERALLQLAKGSDFGDRLHSFLGEGPHLIVGSGWNADMELVLRVFQKLRHDPGISGGVVIAPHDVGQARLSWVEDLCQQLDLKVARWGAVMGESPPKRGDVLLVDRIGLLAELYQTCHLAFIGGAMHDKVHNVLEPACYGLYIAHGPRYQNSREASVFVDAGMTAVIHSENELIAWWQSKIRLAGRDDVLLKKVREMTGASARIEQDIRTVILTGQRDGEGQPGHEGRGDL